MYNGEIEDTTQYTQYWAAEAIKPAVCMYSMYSNYSGQDTTGTIQPQHRVSHTSVLLTHIDSPTSHLCTYVLTIPYIILVE